MRFSTNKFFLLAGAGLAFAALSAQAAFAGGKSEKGALKADVVVVGAGGAGLSAAVQARELGLNVILLEKNAFTGGTTIMTEGMFAVGSHFQKDAGIALTAADILKGVVNYHHYVTDTRLSKKYFESSAANIDWLEALGVKFTEVSYMGDSVKTWHLFDGMGAGYMKSMTAAAQKAGVNIMLETPGKELVMKDGKVAGIVAKTKDGKDLKIEAPVVILSTGGYAENPEMVRKYIGIDPERTVAMGIKGRDGDGIAMGLSAGADTWHLGTAVYYGGQLKGITYGTHLYTASCFQPTMVWVNEQGQRFVDETIAGTNFVYSGNVIKTQKRVVSVMNKANLDYLVENGCIIGTGGYTLTGTKLDKLWTEMDEQIKKGNKGIYVADTIAELAAKTGIDAASLGATMKAYNAECASGTDSEFGKAAQYMVPLSSGPYYGFELALGYFCTVGGLRVNLDAQVVDAAGAAIPGLYATGGDAGGLYSDSYDVGAAAGSQQGWAVASGRFAGKNAAVYLKK